MSDVDPKEQCEEIQGIEKANEARTGVFSIEPMLTDRSCILKNTSISFTFFNVLFVIKRDARIQWLLQDNRIRVAIYNVLEDRMFVQ